MNGKRIGILIIVLAASGLFWFLAGRWIADASLSLGAMWIWGAPLAGLILLSAVAGLASMLLKERRWRFAAVAAMNIPPALTVGLLPVMNMVVVVLVFLMNWHAGSRIADELTARTVINPKRIVGAGVASIITAILIAVSFVYYGTPAVQTSAQKGQLPSAIARAVQSTARQVSAVQFAGFSPAQRLQAESQIARVVMAQLNSWTQPYVKYLPSLLAFGLFLVLRAFSFLFIPLSTVLAGGIFAILKRIGFISIETRDAKAEVLMIS